MNEQQIMQSVIDGTISSADAVKALIGLGYIEAVAQEQIFLALGGDDVVEDDAQRIKNIRASK